MKIVSELKSATPVVRPDFSGSSLHGEITESLSDRTEILYLQSHDFFTNGNRSNKRESPMP